MMVGMPTPAVSHVVVAAVLVVLAGDADTARALEPIPEKLVVLTFDDSVFSHYTVVRPLLKEYGFGATFFITEGFDFTTNKQDYMTWEQIAELHRDGFEIGNHTRDHMGVAHNTLHLLEEQIEAINARCTEYGIPRTTTFAYPGNFVHEDGYPILRKLGIRFARRGGAPEFPYAAGRGFAYDPEIDHPMLIPSAGDARPDWTFADFLRAVSQAKDGKIVVLQFHGVPDRQHPWVHTPHERFASYLNYLKVHGYQVIALRDLAKYVDPNVVPAGASSVVDERRRRLAEAAAQHRDGVDRPETIVPEWIWSGEPQDGEATYYFRRAFTWDASEEAGGVPSETRLQVATDEECTVYVNGQEVGHCDKAQPVLNCTVERFLQRGRNVLAIRARDHEAPAGMIARLELTPPGTEAATVVVASDRRWLVTPKAEPGWNSAEVVPDDWQPAESQGKLGVEPWGDVFSSSK